MFSYIHWSKSVVLIPDSVKSSATFAFKIHFKKHTLHDKYSGVYVSSLEKNIAASTGF